jgi:hypothetical protein
VTAVAVGSATITATSEGKTGTASLTVSGSVGLCQTRSVTLGTTYTGALQSGDCQYGDGGWYDRFRSQLSSTVAVSTVLTSSFASSIFAQSTAGVIGGWNSTGSGTQSVEWLLPAGTFDFDVSRAQTLIGAGGTYSLQMVGITSDTASCGRAVSAARGVTITRALTSTDCNGTRGKEDKIWVYLQQGQTLTATMTSSAFDSYLFLYAEDGTTLLASNDDGLGNGSGGARLVYTATRTGYLQIRPTSYSSGSTGAYSFGVSW